MFDEFIFINIDLSGMNMNFQTFNDAIFAGVIINKKQNKNVISRKNIRNISLSNAYFNDIEIYNCDITIEGTNNHHIFINLGKIFNTNFKMLSSKQDNFSICCEIEGLELTNSNIENFNFFNSNFGLNYNKLNLNKCSFYRTCFSLSPTEEANRTKLEGTENYFLDFSSSKLLISQLIKRNLKNQLKGIEIYDPVPKHEEFYSLRLPENTFPDTFNTKRYQMTNCYEQLTECLSEVYEIQESLEKEVNP